MAKARHRPEVPSPLVERLRAICLALPAAYEENAWTGVRWVIGKRNFAHAVMIANGWPPAYVRAAGTDGPRAVLTFRVPEGRHDATRFASRPFFKPVWWPDVAGIALDDGTDWALVESLVADSYRALAPKRLLGEEAPPPRTRRR